MDALLAQFIRIAKAHQREHDARAETGLCCCTLCRQTDRALRLAEPLCSVCGDHADGTHEGEHYCARCLAERQADEESGL